MFEKLAQYRALINSVPEIMFRIDANGTIRFINAAVEILGFSAPDLEGKGLSCLFQSGDLDRVNALIRQVQKNNTKRKKGSSFFSFSTSAIEVRLLTSHNGLLAVPIAEDELFIGELNLLTVEENTNTDPDLAGGVIGIIRDITRRKKAEELLRKLLWAVDQTPLSIIITDDEGVVEYINPQFIQTTGFSPQEVIGNKVGILKSRYHPEEFYKQLNDSLQLDGEWRGELVNQKKNGSYYWNALTISAVRNPGGNITNYISIQEDITEKKKAQKQLKTLREKEVLLREIHHRVKNNLQIIMSLVNLQTQSIENTHFLDVFKKFENRILSLALIHEKLYRSPDIARIEFGDYIRSLVSHIMQKHCNDPETTKINIACDQIFLDIDTAIPMGLIVNEMVTNSLIHAFGRKGEGQISIKMKDREGHYFLEIADNGCGMPENITIESGGALGMQLIRVLVNQLHGVVTLGRDRGTQFRLSIPH